MIDAEHFMSYANSLGRGYVKPWKAISMTYALTKMPEILLDHDSLLSYVRNCLLMEGFSEQGCKNIVAYLKENSGEQ